MPKLFTVEATLKPAATFRFIDKQIGGAQARVWDDATLCRIAIAQFLRIDSPLVHACIDLDLAVVPYDGDVFTRNGRRLSEGLRN